MEHGGLDKLQAGATVDDLMTPRTVTLIPRDCTENPSAMLPARTCMLNDRTLGTVKNASAKMTATNMQLSIFKRVGPARFLEALQSK